MNKYPKLLFLCLISIFKSYCVTTLINTSDITKEYSFYIINTKLMPLPEFTPNFCIFKKTKDYGNNNTFLAEKIEPKLHTKYVAIGYRSQSDAETNQLPSYLPLNALENLQEKSVIYLQLKNGNFVKLTARQNNPGSCLTLLRFQDMVQILVVNKKLTINPIVPNESLESSIDTFTTNFSQSPPIQTQQDEPNIEIDNPKIESKLDTEVNSPQECKENSQPEPKPSIKAKLFTALGFCAAIGFLWYVSIPDIKTIYDKITHYISKSA